MKKLLDLLEKDYTQSRATHYAQHCLPPEEEYESH